MINLTSPYAVREVERAASDLRRGEAVLVRQVGPGAIVLRSGEHYPDELFISDPAHPAVKLLKIAGLLPHAVLAPGIDEAEGILAVSAQAIDAYPQALAASLARVSEASVPLTASADAKIIAYRPRFGHDEHLAVIIGAPEKLVAPYVRIHSSCVTGDVFGSLRCDCGGQLHKALSMIRQAGGGAIIYLSQEGRGIGIATKLRAYQLQDKGLDTVDANIALGFAADERDFGLAASMLKDLGLLRITLLTNNPGKVDSLRKHGIMVDSRLPLVIDANPYNERYLDTKALKLGHQF